MFAGVPKGAMLTHGNLVADSAGMVRVTYVAPGVVKTAFGTDESVPGKTVSQIAAATATPDHDCVIAWLFHV